MKNKKIKNEKKKKEHYYINKSGVHLLQYTHTHIQRRFLTAGKTLMRSTEARARRFPWHLFTDMRYIPLTIMTHVSSSTFYPQIYRNLSSAGFRTHVLYNTCV
jgi:hypothetical protein